MHSEIIKAAKNGSHTYGFRKLKKGSFHKMKSSLFYVFKSL